MIPHAKTYKHAILVGPGGMGCSCCMPRESVKASRIAINRNFRRNDKVKIKKELKETDDE